MAGYVQLTADNSFDVYLAAETKPVVNVPNKRLALEIDTATWYIFWDGV